MGKKILYVEIMRIRNVLNFFFQYLVRLKLSVFLKKRKKKIILDYGKKEGYLVKPKVWLKIKFLTKNSILMVVCDKEYEFDDYIEKFEDFLKIIKKNSI
jgi:hypothetical protein